MKSSKAGKAMMTDEKGKHDCASFKSMQRLSCGRVVFDLDDTIFDFKSSDKKIIMKIFKSDRKVLAIDNLLWWINSLDIFSNGMKSLRIRLWLYALIAGKDFKQILRQYRLLYKYELKNYNFSKFVELTSKLKEQKYIVEVRSNNYFASRFHIAPDIYVDHYSTKKTTKSEVSVKFIVGDKLSDLFAAQKCGAKFIYVKKSIIMKIIVKLTSNFTLKGGLDYILTYID